MREKRKLLFSEVDAAFMRAQMQGLSTTEIAAKAQHLRDVTASAEIEQAQSIEELKELWPLDVLGDTPYVPPQPPPPAVDERKAFAVAADGRPLWSKREYNAYMAEAEAVDEEAEAAPEPEQIELENFLATMPAPPVARHATRDKGSLKDAMRRVEEAEDFDAPLPEYVPPPPEPTAADVFDVTREFKQAPGAPAEQEPARKRLRTAYSKACATLNEDRWEYDIAVMAGHGNNEQAANLDMTAKRRGIGVQDVADEIITNYRGCERALSAIREINEIALTDMVARPGDSQAIVNEAIGLINEMVGHATAYRS